MTAADLKDLTRWGPFTGSLSHVDLVCRLRVLRAFCQLYIPPPAPIVKALWLAESGEPAEVEEARIEFDAAPGADHPPHPVLLRRALESPPKTERKTDVPGL
jgi:hypothetical protein